MALIELTDKKRIHSLLVADPTLHGYAIGDLDDFFFPRTRWYTLDAPENAPVFMLYKAGDLNVLHALEEIQKPESIVLLDHLLPHLPDKVYCHLTPGLAPIMESAYVLEPRGQHHKMRLTGSAYKTLMPPAHLAYRFLSDHDILKISDLYYASYPDNWFDATMLTTGKYVGLFDDGVLVTIAGVHVYSERYRVAVMGNITTHPAHRNKGYAKAMTAYLCRDLIRTVDYMTLNVDADNPNAISAYTEVGFTYHTCYEEYAATRKF